MIFDVYSQSVREEQWQLILESVESNGDELQIQEGL